MNCPKPSTKNVWIDMTRKYGSISASAGQFLIHKLKKDELV
jgi:hypothetical protein